MRHRVVGFYSGEVRSSKYTISKFITYFFEATNQGFNLVACPSTLRIHQSMGEDLWGANSETGGVAGHLFH